MTQPPQPPRDPFEGPDSPDPPATSAAEGPVAPPSNVASSAPSTASATPTTAPAAAAAPPKVPFDLQEGEGVVKVARRHWAFLTVNLGKVALMGLIPIIAVIVLVQLTSGFDGTVGRVVIAVLVLWAIFWAIRGYFTWYKYQNDQWVLTNQRIVDSQRNHWFHHRMSSADLVNVEDMSVNKSGIFPTMFNYGDLLAQTAGSREKFILSGIPDPTAVLSLVDRYRDAAKRELIRGNLV